MYVGSSDGRLYVLDAASGRKEWEFDAGAALTASPAIAGGRSRDRVGGRRRSTVSANYNSQLESEHSGMPQLQLVTANLHEHDVSETYEMGGLRGRRRALLGRVRRDAAPGAEQLGNPLKALLCVGVAYFLVGVIVPVGALSAQGQLGGFEQRRARPPRRSPASLGAVGAVCIIWSFRTGGIPLYVMPLVFGGAPIINVLYSMIIHPPKSGAQSDAVSSGFLLASIGAGMVLYFRPTA